MGVSENVFKSKGAATAWQIPPLSGRQLAWAVVHGRAFIWELVLDKVAATAWQIPPLSGRQLAWEVVHGRAFIW